MDSTEKQFVMTSTKNYAIPLAQFREMYKKRFGFYPVSGNLARFLIAYDRNGRALVTGFDSDIDSCPKRLMRRAQEIEEYGL